MRDGSSNNTDDEENGMSLELTAGKKYCNRWLTTTIVDIGTGANQAQQTPFATHGSSLRM